MATWTWGKFGEKFGEKFSDAYSKADARRAEKKEKEDEKRKKLRADVAKLENAIRSASGEEIELATGIKPRTEVQSEGMLFPEKSSVQATPADQIFKKLKNKSLMERFAGLEAVADRLPEARTELRAIRREDRFNEQVEQRESDAIMKESFKDYDAFKKEEEAKKDASDRWITEQHEQFLDKQEADKKAAKAEKEADDLQLSRMFEGYERLVPEFEKEEAIGDNYDKAFKPTADHSKLMTALMKASAPYSDWAKPSVKKSFLRNPNASAIIDAASLYTKEAGVPPETSYALSPRFLADMSRKEREKASGKAAEKELALNKAAAGAMLGKPIPDSLPPADRRIVEGKVSLLKMQQEISIQEEGAAAKRAFDIKQGQIDIVEEGNYRRELITATAKSDSLTENGLPKWAIVPKGSGDDTRLGVAMPPNVELTPAEKEKLDAAYKAASGGSGGSPSSWGQGTTKGGKPFSFRQVKPIH